MYCTSESYPEAFYQSKLFRFYFEDASLGVLDIETTGLNPDRNRFILGGLVVPDNRGKKAVQLFSESKEEESVLLRSFLDEIKELDVAVSYNGDHFDLPFLSRRLRHNRIPGDELPIFQSFDLYRILDRYSNFRKLLPNLRQKTVEAFLGLWSDRADEISGAESVELYNRYLRTKDPALRDVILLHNRDDILQLSRMIKVFEKLDLHKIMFHSGFIVSNQGRKAFIRKIDLQKDAVFITGIHKNISMDYRCYQASHEAAFSVNDHGFTLRIPFEKKLGSSYIDLEEFLYDFSALSKYPGCESGYLIIKDDEAINYAEVNHLIKLLLMEILKELS